MVLLDQLGAWNSAGITQERYRVSIDIEFGPNSEDIRVRLIPCYPSPWQDDDGRTRGFLYLGRLDEVTLDQRRLRRSMTIGRGHLQVEEGYS